MKQLLSFLLFVLAVTNVEAGGRDTCACVRKRLCNGIMCDNVCAVGSVVIDPWVDSSLSFQRRLQWDEPLIRATLMGSHNSAISQAYGFGIEQDFIGKLLNRTEYVGDDLGEGVCQSLSVVDQLRMGLRHIEIDITSGYFLSLEPGIPHINEMFVCHSPFPLDPELIAKTEQVARKEGLDLGWAIKNLSCLGIRVPLRDMLMSIKVWMDLPENRQEVVVIYLDTKPLTATLPSQVSSVYKTISDVFGVDGVFKPKDGNPLEVKMGDFVRLGKRVIFEDHEKEWNHPETGDVIVFTPDLFNQFEMGDFVPYPNCTVKGVRGWQGSVWQRALSTPYSFAAEGTVCGVNIVSPDYVQPRDMVDYVWSWAPQEYFDSGSCVVMKETGRWYASDCGLNYSLACRGENDTHWWLASPNKTCPVGFTAQAPTNGFANKGLAAMIQLRRVGWGVYINVSLPSNSYFPRGENTTVAPTGFPKGDESSHSRRLVYILGSTLTLLLVLMFFLCFRMCRKRDRGGVFVWMRYKRVPGEEPDSPVVGFPLDSPTLD